MKKNSFLNDIIMKHPDKLLAGNNPIFGKYNKVPIHHLIFGDHVLPDDDVLHDDLVE